MGNLSKIKQQKKNASKISAISNSFAKTIIKACKRMPKSCN